MTVPRQNQNQNQIPILILTILQDKKIIYQLL